MAGWFKDTPTLIKEPVVTVRIHWRCIMKDCEGEMIYNGAVWPMTDQGYHHTCDQCGFTAVITGHRYPEIQYEGAQ